MPLPKPENAAQALGHLLVGALADAMVALDLYGACCDRCCGACQALQWYRDHDRVTADRALRSIWDGTDAERWEFQRPDGGIDWKVIEEAWVNSGRRGCHANTSDATEPSTEVSTT